MYIRNKFVSYVTVAIIFKIVMHDLVLNWEHLSVESDIIVVAVHVPCTFLF